MGIILVEGILVLLPLARMASNRITQRCARDDQSLTALSYF